MKLFKLDLQYEYTITAVHELITRLLVKILSAQKKAIKQRSMCTEKIECSLLHHPPEKVVKPW
jgi:hypothetical protein